MSKFTRGPWISSAWTTDAGWAPSTQRIQIETEDGAYLIATYNTDFCEYPDNETNAANARLISAAPDLLSAAKCAANVLALLSKEVEALGLRAENVPQMLRDAIAKAEGQS